MRLGFLRPLTGLGCIAHRLALLPFHNRTDRAVWNTKTTTHTQLGVDQHLRETALTMAIYDSIKRATAKTQTTDGTHIRYHVF